MQNPIISVVMSTFNRAEYIKESIDSILNQTFTNFEFIIINDGSTDNTSEIVRLYDDNRIKFYVNDKNYGCTFNYHKMQNIAVGKYIAHIDDDDISRKTRLQTQFDFMENNPDIILSGTYISTFGENKRKPWVFYTDHKKLKFSMFFFNPFCHSSVIYRLKSLKNMKINYNNQNKYAQDYAFYKDIIFNGNEKVANIPEILVDYRMHQKRITDINFSRRIQEQIANNLKREMLSTIFNEEEIIYFLSLVKDFPFGNYNSDDVKKATDFLSKKLLSESQEYAQIAKEFKEDIDNGIFIF